MEHMEEGSSRRPMHARRQISPRRILLIVVVLAVPLISLAAAWAGGFHEAALEAVFAPPLAPASGRITFGGAPVATGTVLTLPSNDYARPAIGTLGPDGTFELRTDGELGAAVGVHRMCVVSNSSGVPRSLVPGRYRNMARTPLTITVSRNAESNQFLIDLQDAPTAGERQVLH